MNGKKLSAWLGFAAIIALAMVVSLDGQAFGETTPISPDSGTTVVCGTVAAPISPAHTRIHWSLLELREDCYPAGRPVKTGNVLTDSAGKYSFSISEVKGGAVLVLDIPADRKYRGTSTQIAVPEGTSAIMVPSLIRVWKGRVPPISQSLSGDSNSSLTLSMRGGMSYAAMWQYAFSVGSEAVEQYVWVQGRINPPTARKIPGQNLLGPSLWNFKAKRHRFSNPWGGTLQSNGLRTDENGFFKVRVPILFNDEYVQVNIEVEGWPLYRKGFASVDIDLDDNIQNDQVFDVGVINMR